jgi:hypothetical protein
MQDTTAFRIGQIAGVLMVLAAFVGITVFFVIALVKAFKTKRAGWIIGAILSGIPFLLLAIVFMFGVARGFKQAMNRSAELVAAKKHEPSQLVTAAMTPVTGSTIPYSISLPWLDDWHKSDNHVPFDYMFNYRDAYVGVVAEGIGMGTPERIRDFTQKNLATKADSYSATTATNITIDAHTWITYDADATMHGVKIKYRFFVYADADYTFQIITWTGPALFDHFSPVFDRVAGSFKMPAPTK